MRTLAIVQARTSSTRLPGKVLKPLAGAPLIVRLLERLRLCRTLDAVVVATSLDPSDDPLAAVCEQAGAAVHRGPLNDVLARFVGALDAFGEADVAVRLTADCPLHDPAVIDRVVLAKRVGVAPYVSNTIPDRTYPIGLDVEAFDPELLRIAHAESADAYEREHVTPFVYRRPERFALHCERLNAALADRRWVVDTAEDYDFVARVYDRLHGVKPGFGLADVLALEAEGLSRRGAP